MAHDRKRQVDDLFKKLIAFSPIVGVFGHRQVGKSTLTAKVAGQYFTLDDKETRTALAKNAKGFLHAIKKNTTTGTTGYTEPIGPIGIDECQIEPDLFPALKEHVRLKKMPGQFILTGSVRFTSRKAIRESLAGRLVSLELLPLTVSEIMETGLPNTIPELLQSKLFSESSFAQIKNHQQTLLTAKSLDKFLHTGGLPGLCFIREERLRREALSSLHSLILDRDLRLILETSLSQETLMRFLRFIASQGWNPINHSEIKRQLGLAHKTQIGLLYALESVFIIRRIPLIGRSGEIFLMEDQYEEYILSDQSHAYSDQILSAIFRNIRAQFQYRLGDVTRFESYWTRSGARVPLVIRNESGVLGIIVTEEDSPTLSQRRSGDSFLRRETQGKLLYLSLYSGYSGYSGHSGSTATTTVRPRIIDPRSMICAAASIL